jgi:hypothetical protein
MPQGLLFNLALILGAGGAQVLAGKGMGVISGQNAEENGRQKEEGT